MPAWKTNGKAANDTAIAVTAAIKATDIYYAANSTATAQQVGDFFRESLNVSLAVFGGTVTDREPFSIRSPAPYLRSIIGAGTDCN
jgi:hypothetical protein